MTEKIFTFWEGPMPEYIKLCLETWKFPFTILTYNNLKQYTDYDVKRAKSFTLPIQADVVRVHVLRDQGGYWLDADTIMLTDHLPDADILGNLWEGTNNIGYLRSEKHSPMFDAWAEYQDDIIKGHGHAGKEVISRWSILGNDFTDSYLARHNDVKIGSIQPCFPEVYKINGEASRHNKYIEFYFNQKFQLSDIKKADMLMLHNSWTPEWYKLFTKDQVLSYDCTLSNILREVGVSE